MRDRFGERGLLARLEHRLRQLCHDPMQPLARPVAKRRLDHGLTAEMNRRTRALDRFARRRAGIDREPQPVQGQDLAQGRQRDRARRGSRRARLSEMHFDVGGFAAKVASMRLSSTSAEASATTASTSSSVTLPVFWA